MRFYRILGRWPDSPQRVCPHRNVLKMRWIHATLIPAQVVYELSWSATMR